MPADQRYCRYCRPLGDHETELQGFVDNEYHLLAQCGSLQLKRNCFLSAYEQLQPGIRAMPAHNMVHTILCPTSTKKAKLTNKFIKILFESRWKLDEGVPILNGGYEMGVAVNPFFDSDDDNDCESL